MTGSIDSAKIRQIVEAALLATDEPLTIDRLVALFKRGEISRDEARQAVREALARLTEEAEGRGYEVKKVATGYRYQVRQELSMWVSRLWEEKPPRYSRALLETLALIAYKQPVTRGDIEQIRGVSVSPNIMRTLQERGWIRVVGQKEVAGRPNMYGSTKAFLDYFNLSSLSQLPPLAEIKSMIEPMVVDEPPPPTPQVELPTDEEFEAHTDAADEPGGEPVDELVGEPDAQPDQELAEVVRLPTAPH